MDAPPADYTPGEPQPPAPPTAQQQADQHQFQRVGEFQNRVMDEVNALAERLRSREQGNFVSLYFDNEGDPSVVFQFLRDPQATLAKYTRNPDFRAERVLYTEEHLQEVGRAFFDRFAQDRVIEGFGTGNARNRVMVMLKVPREDFLALAKRKGVAIPPEVVLESGYDQAIGNPDPEPRIASLLRIFPRDNRPSGAIPAVANSTRVVLEDGCFRAPERENALVLFPVGTTLFVDEEGYLAFGSPDMPGYGRVGEVLSFGGTMPEITTPELVDPIHAACGEGPVIKIEGTRSGAADRADWEAEDNRRALNTLTEGYGLTAAQARDAMRWLEQRQAKQPRQTAPDGTPFPPITASMIVNAPPRPPQPDTVCPPGTTMTFGICRTPEGYMRPLPDWLREYLAQAGQN